MKKIFSLFLILIIGCLFITTDNYVLAKKDRTNAEIDSLNKEINDKTKLLDDLNNKIRVYQENIKKKQEEKLNLTNQLEIIENSISKNEVEITKTETEISKLSSQIKLIKSKIIQTQEDIDAKQNQVSNYILNIYKEEQKTNLEILLTNDTLSDYFSHLEYSRQLQKEFQKTLNQLQTLKNKLKTQKKELNDNKKDKENKKQALDLQQTSLKGERVYKDNLIKEVEDDEEKFQELVKKVKQEQNTVNDQITALEKEIRTKMDQEKNDNNNNTNQAVDDSNIIMPKNFKPKWPVTGRKITAYFHDPTYPFKKWFEHTAIDIAMPHGSPVYATDTGVVAIAKHDGSTSYSYIMIVHADGFASIYGHMSAVYVSPNQKVRKGQTIGLSGGMPGTPGAGIYTTGPHLHFGIRLNGIPVNPLNYLP